MRIARVRAVPLEAPLTDPFVVATATLDRVRNVAVAVTLADGTTGWGEVPTLWPITRETFADAVAGVEAAAPTITGRAVDALVLDDLSPAVACGILQAAWDAAARSRGVPLYRRFGDVAAPVVTDITLPICAPGRAAVLAAEWRARGFTVAKVKVGKDLDADLVRIEAIARAWPEAALVLDANEGWSVEDALAAVAACRRLGARVLLLEQPVHRDDRAGMARLVRESGVAVAADEACRSAADVAGLARERACTVVNVKLAKSGVPGVLAIVAEARAHGLGLMIGGMVETRIGMGFAAHLAAGIGGFTVIDLDTPWLLARDPVAGGTMLDGPRWRVGEGTVGHGGIPVGSEDR